MRTYSPFCGCIYDRWAYYFSCCIQKKTCLTDSPSERKAHIGEVALVGGLAIGMDLTVSLTMLPTPEKNIWVVSNGPQKLDSSISALPGYAANLAAG